MTSYHFNSAGRQDAVIDPRGIVTATLFDDAGRTVATIGAYSGSLDGIESIDLVTIKTLPTTTTDLVTLFYNDDAGHMIESTTVGPYAHGGPQQMETTQYVYGVNASTGSDIDSRDLLYQVLYADVGSGTPTETYAYNEAGQVKTFTDRNGTTHSYQYDELGGRPPTSSQRW